MHITALSRIPLPQGLLHGLHSSVIHLKWEQFVQVYSHYYMQNKWTKDTITYFGGHICELHGTTDVSGRVMGLHNASSASAPEFRLRHIGLDIL